MEGAQEKILRLLKRKDEDITTSQIADEIRIERHTAAKHLESLRGKGLIEYRTIGKSKVWKLSKSPFLEALKSNEAIGANLKNILSAMDERVSIQSPDFRVIWTNRGKEKAICHEAYAGSNEKCENCPVEKTFRTGKPGKAIIRSSNKGRFEITTQPIRDNSNRTVAVIEIAKQVKRK